MMLKMNEFCCGKGNYLVLILVEINKKAPCINLKNCFNFSLISKCFSLFNLSGLLCLESSLSAPGDG